MTTQLPKERLTELAHNILACHDVSPGEIKTMASVLLAAYEQEPVAWLNDAYLARGVVDGEAGSEDNGPGYIPVYRNPAPSIPAAVPDYFAGLVASARVRADKAMRKFPQPNYVLNKVAEESGEVIKAVIHYTEGREEWANVEGELIDNLAMLIRLVTEGDQVIGFTPPDTCRAAMLQSEHDGWIPVSERLPLTPSADCEYSDIEVNVFDGEHVFTAHYETGSQPQPWGDWEDTYAKITHWQPLPAAPKGV